MASTTWAARAAKLVERDGDRCCWCRGPLEFGGDGPDHATFDHLVPRWRGGTRDLENLMLAHWRCNQDRADANAAKYALSLIEAGWAPPVDRIADAVGAYAMAAESRCRRRTVVRRARTEARRLRSLAQLAMPAATVSPSASSTRMNAPVGRSSA